jgi:hypothetical protein
LVSDGGYEIKGSDMFTIYVAEEDFEFREVGFFTDNVVTIGEVNTSIIDIGKPVRYMKVEVEPLVIMDLYNVKVLSEKKDHLTPKASYLTSSTEETTLHLDYEEERVLQIENKLNVNADILVDILRSDDSSRRETVVKCKLDSVESLELPEVGPSARYSLNQDVELKIRYDVAQDRPCYGTYSLNANNNGASDWVSLGTRVTDGNSPDAIDAPIGKDSESDDSQVFYSGLAVSGGVYNETYDITYTVVIDTTNGVAAGYGSGQVPTFTVTSSPDVDDVNTPTEILEYGVFYSVGTKGVLIKFEDVALFGSTDIFIIRARATAEALTSVNAKEYGHVAVDLQEFFEIEDIVIEGSAERITQDISVYWSDSLDWESASSGNTSNMAILFCIDGGQCFSSCSSSDNEYVSTSKQSDIFELNQNTFGTDRIKNTILQYLGRGIHIIDIRTTSYCKSWDLPRTISGCHAICSIDNNSVGDIIGFVVNTTANC